MIVKNLTALSATFLIIIVDQLSKYFIKTNLQLNEFVSIIGKYVGFRFIQNPGMAFGIQIGGGRTFFIIFTSIASLLIFIFLLRLKDDHYWTRIALASILGGAVGNLIDRIVYDGKVVDFIEIGPWPIFNFADVAVTFGMIILIIIVFFEKKEDDEQQEQNFEVRY